MQNAGQVCEVEETMFPYHRDIVARDSIARDLGGVTVVPTQLLPTLGSVAEAV